VPRRYPPDRDSSSSSLSRSPAAATFSSRCSTELVPGIGSIAGAALGGLILGLLESVGPSLFLNGLHIPGPNQLKDVIAFAILVLVLIFRPGGLLGTGEAEKV